MVSDVLNLRLPSNWVTSKSENALFDISANQVIAQNLSAIADVNFQSFGVTANFLASATFKASDGTTAFTVASATGMTTFPAAKLTLTDFITPSIAVGDIMKSDGTSFKRLARGTANQVLTVNGSGTDIAWVSNPGFPHNLLDGSDNQDTVASAAVQGSIILGNSTPKWATLGIGANNTIPVSNGTTLSYGTLGAANITAGDTLLEKPADYIIRPNGTNCDIIDGHTGAIVVTNTELGAAMTTLNGLFGTQQNYVDIKSGHYIQTSTWQATKAGLTIRGAGGGFRDRVTTGTQITFSGLGSTVDGWIITPASGGVATHATRINDISFNKDSATACRYQLATFANGQPAFNCWLERCYFEDQFASSNAMLTVQSCDALFLINCWFAAQTSLVGGEAQPEMFFSNGNLQLYLTNCHFSTPGGLSAPRDGISFNSDTQVYLTECQFDSLRYPFVTNGSTTNIQMANVGFYNNTHNFPNIVAGTIRGTWAEYGVVATPTFIPHIYMPNITDYADSTKLLSLDLSGLTTGITLTLKPASSTSQTLTIPNITASDTLVTLGLAQTHTAAKTFPANGIILGGAGAGLSTLTYANSASSTTFTIPATTGTAALLAQLTDGTTISGIVNAQIAAGAAIAKSKISTSGTWVEADLPATTVFTDATATMTSAHTYTTKLLKIADISDSNANIGIALTATASAVDYFTAINAATANPATIKYQATGSDSNINTLYSPKGTGKFQVSDGTDLTKILALDVSGNTTAITGTLAFAFTTAKTITFPNATTTLAGLAVAETWTAAQTFTTGLIKAADIVDANGNVALAFTATGSAVDGFTLVNAATANPATVNLNATGTDTNINALIQGKGTGTIQFNQSGQTTRIVSLDPSGLGTNSTTYTLAFSNITANRTLTFPLITASDTVDTLGLAQTFTAAKTFTTGLLKVADIADANANLAIAITATASAVDYITVVNAATANPANIQINPTGTDTNIGITFNPKGSGKTNFAVVSATPVSAPINLGSVTANPTTVTGGDIWFRSDTGNMMYRSGGTNTFANLEGAQTFSGIKTYSIQQSWTAIADPAAAAGLVWRSSTNTDVLKYSNATKIFNITSAQGITSQKSESAADTSVLSFTPASQAGTYRISFVISVSAATAATLGWTATWTDSNGQAQAPTNLSLYKSGSATPILTNVVSANDAYYGEAIIDINNAGTAIVLKLTFTGTSFTARVTGIVEKLN